MSKRNKNKEKAEEAIVKENPNQSDLQSVETVKNPEHEALEFGEKVQETVSFEKPTEPAVLSEDISFDELNKDNPPQMNHTLPDEVDISNAITDKELVEKAKISLTPTEIESHVSGEVDLTNPGYEEIKTILSQWNFKHGTNFELNGNILTDNTLSSFGAPTLIDELKQDLKDWYYNLIITDLKNGTYELMFA